MAKSTAVSKIKQATGLNPELFSLLSEAEIKVLRLALEYAQEQGAGLNSHDFLLINASDYAQTLAEKPSDEYQALLMAVEELFEDGFEFSTETTHFKARWIASMRMAPDDNEVGIVLASSIVRLLKSMYGTDVCTKHALKNKLLLL